MSDEAAFLEALKANPADDTTRLVYADWLDEHNEPAKAEYLRLVATVASAGKSSDVETVQADRAMALAAPLSIDWRMAAAARFMVVLYGYEPTQKIHTIKVIREVLGFGLAESKAFSESLPAQFPLRTTVEHAVGLRYHLITQAKCRASVHPCDIPVLPRSATYRIFAELVHNGWHDYTDGAPAPPPDVLDAFRRFIAALEIADDSEGAQEHEPVELGSGLDPATFEQRMAEFKALLPKLDPDSDWEIALHSYCQLSPSPFR